MGLGMMVGAVGNGLGMMVGAVGNGTRYDGGSSCEWDKV